MSDRPLDPLPWTVLVQAGSARLIDGRGALRATVTGEEAGDPLHGLVSGRLEDGWRGAAELADGRHVLIENGRRKGLRRRHRTVRTQLGGTRWVYIHTSDRRATVIREQAGATTQIARLHHPWRMSSRHDKVGEPVRVDYTFISRGDLQPDDELMITVFGVVLGPPGREGAIGEIGQSVAAILEIFN